MLLLIIGLTIWTLAHLLRSHAPKFRESLQSRFGNAAKGLIGVVILISLVMMIMGYREADLVQIWSPPYWLKYLNNLLMVIALYMYFTTATTPGTAFVFGNLKNPQLTGFKVWALAHLLVNGDLAAIILFGGLLAWAILQVVSSKRVESLVDRNTAPIKSPWIHLALVIVVFFFVSIAHHWLGKYPFAM